MAVTEEIQERERWRWEQLRQSLAEQKALAERVPDLGWAQGMAAGFQHALNLLEIFAPIEKRG